ncbi:MAG TPA: JAB domain-containing protein [Thermoanaerobaculia bacterium]|nr:JAB domain-containing protein [Thermoanaerobaculia bacterium]
MNGERPGSDREALPRAPARLDTPTDPQEGSGSRLLLRVGVGPTARPSAELLGLVLNGGCLDVPTLAMARRVLRELGGLHGLVEAVRAGREVEGLDPRLSCALCAAVELGMRMARADVGDQLPFLGRPDRVARYLALRYAAESQEVMGVLSFDARGFLLGERELFRGALDRIAVEPGPILREALRLSAISFILFHTHPRGTLSPSPEDLRFTLLMKKASKVVGIPLADHLIVTPDARWCSLLAASAAGRRRRRPVRTRTDPC